jgi:hypothetical protein
MDVVLATLGFSAAVVRDLAAVALLWLCYHMGTDHFSASTSTERKLIPGIFFAAFVVCVIGLGPVYAVVRYGDFSGSEDSSWNVGWGKLFAGILVASTFLWLGARRGSAGAGADCSIHKIPLVYSCPACGGAAKPKHKEEAARRNGKLGGRPRKQKGGE